MTSCDTKLWQEGSGLERVGWMFTFTVATYNLIRAKKRIKNRPVWACQPRKKLAQQFFRNLLAGMMLCLAMETVPGHR